MLEWLKFIAVALCLTAGLAAMCVGVFGTYRLKYALNRMHAASMLDTSGLFFISLGLAIAAGFGVTAAKLMLAVLLQWCTCPVAGHLIGRLVVFSEDHPENYMEVQDK